MRTVGRRSIMPIECRKTPEEGAYGIEAGAGWVEIEVKTRNIVIDADTSGNETWRNCHSMQR